MKFHEILTKIATAISKKKLQFCIKPPFSMMKPQIEKSGKRSLCIGARSSYKKFHKIWSRSCGEIASDKRTDDARQPVPG